MSDIPARIGRFDIIEQVGKGATATVYRAVSEDHPEGVAVKHIRFKESGDGYARRIRRLRKLIRAEANVARRLQHPNIIRIHEVVIDDDEAHAVMEYFPGKPLSRFCAFDNLLPLHRVMSIIFKCAMALDHAFRQGVVHRDIKPDNILVNDDDNVKITDFGLALNINKKLDSDSTFILGVGSPAYMSPEQIKNYPLNQKTDLYSLGVVLYHLLTGRLPFRASNHAQLVYRILNADPPPPSKINPELPESVDKVVFKALEKDLYSRYRNGAEFAQDLSGIRYKIVDENHRGQDARRFAALRRLAFFTEFDDIEVWEALRISSWRMVSERTAIFREGDEDERFGVLVEGEIEISIDGKRIDNIVPGEIFGEMAWLDAPVSRQMYTAVSVRDSSYLEVSPAALALASEELRDAFRNRVGSVVARRCADGMRAIATQRATEATRPDRTAMGSADLQLVDD